MAKRKFNEPAKPAKKRYNLSEDEHRLIAENRRYYNACVREKCAEVAHSKGLADVIDIAMDKGVEPRDRLSAWKMIFDRGFGRPAMAVEGEFEGQLKTIPIVPVFMPGPQPPSEMSLEEFKEKFMPDLKQEIVQDPKENEPDN